MKNSIYFFAILSASIFLSCEKDLPFPEQDVQPTLVLNGAFNLDSIWTVHISESAPVNGNSQPTDVVGATAVLKDESGQTIGSFRHQEGGTYLIPDLKPEAGRRYRVEASAPGLPSISAESYQPAAFNFTLSDTDKGVFLDFPVIFIDLEIEDNADETNYYLIEVEKVIELTETEEVYRFVPYLYVFDQNTENDEIDTESAGFERIYLPDETFNGRKYTTRLAVEEDIAPEENQINSEWIIRVSSVSEDLYKYAKTLERYNLSNGELFAEPVEIHNNVKDGLGVFGGQCTKEVRIKF